MDDKKVWKADLEKQRIAKEKYIWKMWVGNKNFQKIYQNDIRVHYSTPIQSITSKIGPEGDKWYDCCCSE